MSNNRRLFLTDGFTDEAGSSVSHGIIFPTEEKLDETLWLDPEQAEERLRYLLKVEGGQLTPALSRIALKALTLPLFTREFQGSDVTLETEEAVNGIASENGTLLNTYLRYINDEDVDQTVLHQAINEATILQLVARSFLSTAEDNIVLLPIAHEEYFNSPKIDFTLLRRKELGRAHLIVSEQIDAFYRKDVNVNPYRIRIKPSEIALPEETFIDLAEALVAEQHPEHIAPVDGDSDRIQYSSGKLFDTIKDHFNKLPA